MAVNPQRADEWPLLATIDESYVTMVVEHVDAEVKATCAAVAEECAQIEKERAARRPA